MIAFAGRELFFVVNANNLVHLILEGQVGVLTGLSLHIWYVQFAGEFDRLDERVIDGLRFSRSAAVRHD
ncbi:MAG: hypothetical protein JOY54_06635 [Acidobacteriaceae bacterium]|nr:hypothetical protein [Acidobacteriaceae bacterium]